MADEDCERGNERGVMEEDRRNGGEEDERRIGAR